MAKRKCDCCGKEVDVYGGKICSRNGHFMCSGCKQKHSKCPICGSDIK